MDFPVKIHDGIRYTVSLQVPWLRYDIPLCSGTDRIFKRSLNRLTVAVIRLSRYPSGSLGNAKLAARLIGSLKLLHDAPFEHDRFVG